MSDDESTGGMEAAIPLTLQEKFDQLWCPRLRTLEEFSERVLADEENLVAVFVIAPSLCPHSNVWLQGAATARGSGTDEDGAVRAGPSSPTLLSISTPQPATVHARFFRIHAEEVDASLIEAGSSSPSYPSFDRTPAMYLYLKGKPFVEAPVEAGSAVAICGSNASLMAGLFRNELIRRNDVMRDYDEAKAAAAAEEAEEAEEGEEGAEEDEDEE